MTIPEKMHEALINEMNTRMLSNVQEVTRLIISEHIRSKAQRSAEKSLPGTSEIEARICEDISQCSFYGEFKEMINVAENCGESSDMAGAVRLYVKMWKSLCALFGFNPESTLSESQRERLNKVLDDDDPCPSRMRFAIAGLQGLVEQDKIVALKNPLNLTMDILVRHIDENF